MSSSQRRKLLQQVNVGLTADEAEMVDRLAMAEGISRAALVRRFLLNATAKPEVTKPRRSTARAPAEIAEIARLIATGGRLAGATIQLSKSIRLLGLTHQHIQAEALLVRLRQHVGQLVQLSEQLNAQRRK